MTHVDEGTSSRLNGLAGPSATRLQVEAPAGSASADGNDQAGFQVSSIFKCGTMFIETDADREPMQPVGR